MSGFDAQLVRLGQEGVLQVALRSHVHAFLLCGPKRAGRDELGRQLCAQLLGKPPDASPPDLWVAPEKMRMDDVRDVRAAAATAPLEGDRKAFLIPGADHLSLQVANALLRTLEEPLPGRFFVLTAAGAASVLPTVASRTLPLTMRPVDPKVVATYLEARGRVPLPLRERPGFPVQMAGPTEADEELSERIGVHLAKGLSGFLALGELLDSERDRGLSQLASLLEDLWREPARERFIRGLREIDRARAELDGNGPSRLVMDVLAYRLASLDTHGERV